MEDLGRCPALQKVRFAVPTSNFAKTSFTGPASTGWWFQPTRLKNMSESQLGWWHSQLNGKSFKIPWFQSPPTSLGSRTSKSWFSMLGVESLRCSPLRGSSTSAHLHKALSRLPLSPSFQVLSKPVLSSCISFWTGFAGRWHRRPCEASAPQGYPGFRHPGPSFFLFRLFALQAPESFSDLLRPSPVLSWHSQGPPWWFPFHHSGLLSKPPLPEPLRLLPVSFQLFLWLQVSHLSRHSLGLCPVNGRPNISGFYGLLQKGSI